MTKAADRHKLAAQMGYLFVMAIILMWTAVTFAVAPIFSVALALIGIAVVLYSYLRNEEQERQYIDKIEREKRSRDASIAEAFLSQGCKILSDKTNCPLVYESRYDAILSCKKVDGWLLELSDKWYIIVCCKCNTDIISKAQIFIRNNYNIDELTNSLKHSITIITKTKLAIQQENQKRIENEEMRRKIITSLLKNVEQRTKTDVGRGGTAVYLMVSDAGCKVGVSETPEKRQRQLQTGHATKLNVYQQWWFFSRNDAILVEKTVHGFLKVGGKHATGEWFHATQREVTQIVGRVIKELISRGEIDHNLAEVDILGRRDDVSVAVGELVHLPWKVSKRGNPFLRIGSHHVVLARRRGRWAYMFNDQWSRESFKTQIEAKAAALQKLLESDREIEPEETVPQPTQLSLTFKI